MILNIILENIDKLILSLIPVISVWGTFLIMSADRNRIKENPLVEISKAASNLTPNYDVGTVKNHDKNIYPRNKKINFRYNCGKFLLIVSVGLTIYKVFY